MSISDNIPAYGTTDPSRSYPHPFKTPEAGYIVLLKGRHGLHEAVEEGSHGRWIFQALNINGQPLVTATADEMIVFELPIYHCFSAHDRSEVVALVSGPDFDVTYNDPEVAAPLFQKVHAADLISFCELAQAAGFSNIELSNGYVPWEGTIDELIGECRELASAT